jgi:membrane protease YdiL (CAAX protease family)
MKRVKIDLSNAQKAVPALFHMKFEPTKDTRIAFLTGLAVVLTSLALCLFSGDSITDEIGFFVLRDMVMMAGIGFVFPLYYVLVIKKEPLKTLGITKDKLGLSLVVNIVLAVILLFQFMKESGTAGKEIFLSSDAIIPIIYIFAAGIFEMVFFYGFLRHQFEQSFGIIPGIVLASMFYSFHHAGFQPEFMKLLFVGIMYASVFRITKNVFIIFGSQEQLQGFWTLTKAISVLLLMFVFSLYLKRRADNKQERKKTVAF